MPSKEKEFTTPMKCGHCQNTAPMEIVATYSTVRDYTDERSGESWEAGTIYELSRCPACDNMTLRSYDWHSGYMDGSDIEYKVLYPFSEKILRGLPRKIDSAYQAANKVRNIDANAYGVLLGRVLDFVCEDRGASGKTLDQKLKSLAQNNEIPSKLVNVAAGLRKLRNWRTCELGRTHGSGTPGTRRPNTRHSRVRLLGPFLGRGGGRSPRKAQDKERRRPEDGSESDKDDK